MNSWWADRNLSPDEIRRQLNTSATTSTDGALAHPAIQVAALNVAREELRKAITLIDVAQRSFPWSGVRAAVRERRARFVGIMPPH